MALTSRLTLPGSGPEDHFASSLGIIFPDDVTCQHSGDEHQLLHYASPHLPHTLRLRTARVREEDDRYLFSHYLWNAGLLLAELIEADSLGLAPPPAEDTGQGGGSSSSAAPGTFDVTGLRTIELGAGTGLPSIMAGLVGARGVVATDFPAPAVLEALEENVRAGVREGNAAPGKFRAEEVRVEGHGWGDLDSATALVGEGRHGFDRVLAADCLWMPWQHDNLRRSIAWFLGDGDGARAWVIGAFHTGRDRMAMFFEKEALAEVGLEVEHLWERDCDGQVREWVWDRGAEEASVRKRWLAVAVLRRIASGKPTSTEGEEVPS